MDQPDESCAVCDASTPPSEIVKELDGVHSFCKECICILFRRATVSEDDFPPHCCDEISLATVRHLLPHDLIEDFEAKSIKFTTINRTYCSKPRCSAFIPPTQIENNLGKCSVCSNETCSFCKKEKHEGSCVIDDETSPFFELAAQEGWQRCTNCGRIVERTEGCNHIS